MARMIPAIITSNTKSVAENVSIIGLIPKIRSFKFSELEHYIASGNFKVAETERLHQSSPIYFIAARGYGKQK
jgi:hypothetical protein